MKYSVIVPVYNRPNECEELLESLTHQTQRDFEVIIVEDIVDTGATMKRMLETLGTREPAGLHICTLLLKPGKLTVPLDIEYAAIEIPNDFIVGYGLDYDQEGRNLRDIYTLVKE